MTRTLNDMIAGLPIDQQREVEAQAARLIEEEMTLRDLRKAHTLTQARMAEALHISQDGVSRIEKRSVFCFRRFAPTSRRWAASCDLSSSFPTASR